VNEFTLIGRHFQRAPRSAAVRVGIGDDGAVISPVPGAEWVVSVDMLVEGRHFFAGTDARRLGHKTLAVNLSDLAAMGAAPRFALLAGALPDADDDWLAAFMQGFRALADRFGVELIGGDTTRGPRNLCVTVIGDVPAGTAITRAGASAGDDIYVSGTLGDAALALAALERRTTLPPDELARAQARLEQPEPRVALGERLRGVATAALDVSDGLVGDLGHILERSQTGAVVDLAQVPHSAALAVKLAGAEHALALQCVLAGGDDYELCFCAPPAERARVAAIAEALAVPVARIGTITAGDSLVVTGADGATMALPRAYDHFVA